MMYYEWIISALLVIVVYMLLGLPLGLVEGPKVAMVRRRGVSTRHHGDGRDADRTDNDRTDNN